MRPQDPSAKSTNDPASSSAKDDVTHSTEDPSCADLEAWLQTLPSLLAPLAYTAPTRVRATQLRVFEDSVVATIKNALAHFALRGGDIGGDYEAVVRDELSFALGDSLWLTPTAFEDGPTRLSQRPTQPAPVRPLRFDSEVAECAAEDDPFPSIERQTPRARFLEAASLSALARDLGVTSDIIEEELSLSDSDLDWDQASDDDVVCLDDHEIVEESGVYVVRVDEVGKRLIARVENFGSLAR